MTNATDTPMRKPQALLAFLRGGRLWIAVAAISIYIALRMAGVNEFLSLDTLHVHRASLVAWVDSHELLAMAAYVLLYVGVVAFSLPGGVYLTLAGGFLFGAVVGATLAVISATAGATIVFLFAKNLFGDRIVDRLAAQHPELVRGVRENAWSYLLVLRFIPLFPFFLVNLVAPLAGVGLSTYAFTTLVGILPGTAIYALAGAGLGSVLDRGGAISINSVLTPEVLASLVGLAVLSLVAIPIGKKVRAGRYEGEVTKPQPRAR